MGVVRGQRAPVPDDAIAGRGQAGELHHVEVVVTAYDEGAIWRRGAELARADHEEYGAAGEGARFERAYVKGYASGREQGYASGREQAEIECKNLRAMLREACDIAMRLAENHWHTNDFERIAELRRLAIIQ
jgi:hypothetical protein